MGELFLGISVFVASAVEMVEALTIMLAIGVTRGWRSVYLATAAAFITLAAIVLVFGQALMKISDESDPSVHILWMIAGGLLLIFGLQWMRKPILRISGILPTRDEDAIYQKTKQAAKKTKLKLYQGIDWYSFVIVYKGVLIEGLEVIFIVIAFGAAQSRLSTAVIAASAAFVFICLLGLVIHKPLSRVPENAMKLTVGVVLATFGTYFGLKGVGIFWPFGEWAILGILAFYSFIAYASILVLKEQVRVQTIREQKS